MNSSTTLNQRKIIKILPSRMGGFTTTEFGDVGRHQSGITLTIQLERIMKSVNASFYLRINPEIEAALKTEPIETIYSKTRPFQNEYLKHNNGLVYVNNLPRATRPVLISVSTYSTLMLTDPFRNFIAITTANYGPRRKNNNIALILETIKKAMSDIIPCYDMKEILGAIIPGIGEFETADEANKTDNMPLMLQDLGKVKQQNQKTRDC